MKLVAILATLIIGAMAALVSADAPPVNLNGCDFHSQWCLTPDGWVSLKVATPTPMPTATPEPTLTATPTPDVWIEYYGDIVFTPHLLAIRGYLHGDFSTSHLREVHIRDSAGRTVAEILEHPPTGYRYIHEGQNNIGNATDWAYSGPNFYIRGQWYHPLSPGEYFATFYHSLYDDGLMQPILTIPITLGEAQ